MENKMRRITNHGQNRNKQDVIQINRTKEHQQNKKKGQKRIKPKNKMMKQGNNSITEQKINYEKDKTKEKKIQMKQQINNQNKQENKTKQ